MRLVRIHACHLVVSNETGSSPVQSEKSLHLSMQVFLFINYLKENLLNMYYVYIIYNPLKDIYYKGYTQNLGRRLNEHNEGCSRYTSSRGPWTLLYQKMYETKREALFEERRLKKLNHESIQKLISSR